MFKKLRLKLSLINISILFAILLAVFLLIFFSIRTNYVRTARNIKHKIERTAQTTEFDGEKTLFQMRAYGENALVIKVAKDGELILAARTSSLIDDVTAKELYEIVKDKDSDMKYIAYDEKDYLTFYIEGELTTFFFIDATQEQLLIASILREMIFIFLGAILLAFIGNLIMTKKALEPIKKVFEKQKQFVGDASHELRTPISSIKVNMEIVSENDEKTIGEHRKWIDNINNETDRMSGLVNKLMFLSRKDSEDPLNSYEIINIANIIRQVISQFEVKFDKKGIALEYSLQNTYVKAEHTDINQLISSILDNAWKYTEKGKVIINLYEADHQAVIRIEDTGIGISEENKPKVFERFYRADKARSGSNEGYGLGLSIVKSIVENYKGKIEVDSTLNKGSIFVIKLPSIEKKGK